MNQENILKPKRVKSIKKESYTKKMIRTNCWGGGVLKKYTAVENLSVNQ